MKEWDSDIINIQVYGNPPQRPWESSPVLQALLVSVSGVITEDVLCLLWVSDHGHRDLVHFLLLSQETTDGV